MKPRHYDGHCRCEDCQEWARLEVARPAQRQPRQIAVGVGSVAPEMTHVEFCERIVAGISKATGISEEKLRGEAPETRRHWLEEQEAKEEP